MATHKSHCASQFALRLRAIATKSGPGQGPRAPSPLVLPFAATYYDLVGEDEPLGDVPSHSPWVADVDLEAHYFEQYTSPTPGPTAASSSEGGKTEPPAYPGYRIPMVGQLQLLIKTPTTAVHAFVVAYDLSSLAPGARLLARERTYVAASSPAPSLTPSPSSIGKSDKGEKGKAEARESLRYAVQLQFTCVPDADASGKGPALTYYLGRTLKLVFTSSPPESGSSVRIERADEVVPPSTPTPPPGAKHSMRGSALRKSISSASPIPLPLSSSPSSPTPQRTPMPSPPPSSSPFATVSPPSPPSPAPSPQRRRSSIEASSEWATVRTQWRMRAAKAAAIARGFDPPPTSRPASPVPAAPSPRSLLSALAPDAEERSVSPGERPLLSRSSSDRPELVRSGSEWSDSTRSASRERGRSEDYISNVSSESSMAAQQSRRTATSRTPSVAGSARRRLSREERELSAKLAAMDLQDCA